MYDTPYWDHRWGASAGYTVFRNSFTSGDLISARVRYERFMDDALARRIGILVPKTIDKRLLWAGIASPREAFWGGDYTDYISAGQSLYETALLNLLVAKRSPNEYLSLDDLKRAKVEATRELRKFGYLGEKVEDRRLSVPTRMKEEVVYEMTRRPDPREVFGDI